MSLREGPRRQLENAVVADGIRFFLSNLFLSPPFIAYLVLWLPLHISPLAFGIFFDGFIIKIKLVI